jgi:transcriptional regulator with XRE-family HTH domain
MKKTIHTEHSKLISQALVRIRNEAGYTQRELAKILGREHSFVAHYELGERRVDLAEFHWICTACDAISYKEAADLMKAFSKLKNH